MKSIHPTHDLSNDKCYSCGKMRHHACSCPNMMDKDCKEIAGVNHCEVVEEIGNEEYCLEGVVFLEPAESKECPTLDWWKLYLNSCATYNQVFVDYLLTDINETNMVLKANCSKGVAKKIPSGVGILSQFHGSKIMDTRLIATLIKSGWS